MSTRPMLSQMNWLRSSASSAAASATGATVTGFEPTNVLSPMLDTCWLVPIGGPHTLTITDSAFAGGVDMICLCAHPEHTFTGTVTVQLVNGGGTVLWTGGDSFRPPIGFSERRYFVTPSRLFGVASMKVTLQSNNRLAYASVCKGIDLTGMVSDTAEMPVIDTVGFTTVGYGAFVADTNKRTVPGRKMKADVVMSALPYTTVRKLFALIDEFGKSEPVLWMPDAAILGGALGNDMEYMHATSVFGQIVNNPSFAFNGNGTMLDDEGSTVTGAIRSGTISIEGWP